MALLSKLKEQMASPQVQAAPTGQTETVRGLLQAKTGKAAAPSSGPRQSALQERLAERQTALGGEQLRQKGIIQAEQISGREADIQQRERQQQQQAQEKGRDIEANVRRQTEAMLNQFETGQRSLESRQDIADLEQVGFGIRLQNEQYVNQLQNIGRKNRLDDKLGFQKELAKTTMADHQTLMQDDIKFKRMMEADEREFREMMMKMNNTYALEMAEETARAASTRQAIEGVGELTTAGAKFAKDTDIFRAETENDKTAKLGAANGTGELK